MTDRMIPYLRSAAGLLLVLGLVPVFWPATLGGQVSYVMVSGTSMEPGLHDGDLVAMRSKATYEVGETIAYRIPEGDAGAGNMVIHRIVDGDGTTGYVTQGDNRDSVDLWRPTDGDVLGVQWVHLPGAGNLMASMRAPVPLAAASAAIVVVLVLWPSPKARRKAAEQAESDDDRELVTTR
jgi:signal peptidase I